MLKELHIKDVAIIDEVSVEFGVGLNILTGETGAGKSIIIGALGLILGSRASGDEIKYGKDKAIVEAIFDVSSQTGVKQYLDTLDVEIDDDDLIIKRIISSSGKNRCYIHGNLVALSTLKTLGNMLIDIHGQHEHQSLINPKTHIALLDACVDLQTDKELVYQKYCMLQKKKKTLDSLVQIDEEKQQQQDFIRFKIQEIEQAGLREEEEEELEKQKNILVNAEKLYNAAGSGYDVIYQSDDAVLTRLKSVLSELAAVLKADSSLEKYIDPISRAIPELEEVALGLRDYFQTIQADPDALSRIDNKLSVINDLKRKYGKSSVAEILLVKEEAKSELEHITSNKRKIEDLRKEVEKIVGGIQSVTEILADKREKLAKAFEKTVEDELTTLNMDNIKFAVNFSYDNSKEDSPFIYKREKVGLNRHGFGQIEFLFSSNMGEPPKPLSKIASGGEISRLMLVLKKLLAGKDNIPTVIFDEIDTGTGGKTAALIGEKLKIVSKSHQVLCITHLPQIASKADEHFLIEKSNENNSTCTSVRKLGKEEKVRELARMYGGKTITAINIKHAEEVIGASA